MNEWEKNRPTDKREGSRDHPEQYPTDSEALFDLWISERNVDPIPMEDLNLEKREEKRKDKTKHTSSTARKYHTGFNN